MKRWTFFFGTLLFIALISTCYFGYLYLFLVYPALHTFGEPFFAARWEFELRISILMSVILAAIFIVALKKSNTISKTNS